MQDSVQIESSKVVHRRKPKSRSRVSEQREQAVLSAVLMGSTVGEIVTKLGLNRTAVYAIMCRPTFQTQLVQRRTARAEAQEARTIRAATVGFEALELLARTGMSEESRYQAGARLADLVDVSRLLWRCRELELEVGSLRQQLGALTGAKTVMPSIDVESVPEVIATP